MNDRDTESKNQEICGKLVDREVYYCVSELISHFVQNPESLSGSDYSWDDDVMPLCEIEDWQETFEESEYDVLDDSFGNWYVIDRETYPKKLEDFQPIEETETDPAASAEDQYDEYLQENGEEVSDPSDYRELCEAAGIDEPYRSEAYEHWIVSSWLARKLKDRGQIVGELFGLTIWGRCTTGQSISMDGVIREIANGMGILAGQENDWSAS